MRKSGYQISLYTIVRVHFDYNEIKVNLLDLLSFILEKVTKMININERKWIILMPFIQGMI